MIAFLDAPGFGEILMILFVALLVFGGNLPTVAKKMGRQISELKKGVSDFREEMSKEAESAPPPSPSDPPTAAPKPPEEKLPQG